MGFSMHTLGRTIACLTVLGFAGTAVAEDVKPPAPQPAAKPAQAAPAQSAPAQSAPARSAPAQAAPAETGANSQGGWVQEVAPTGSGAGIVLDEHQSGTVQKVSDYFANLDGLKGAFVQTSADNKRMRGKFYVKRPGKFRFDYARPSRQVIVSDGRYLAIQDLDLNNEDRVALDETPFRLLLRKDVNLLRDATIFEVQESEDQIVLGLQDKNPEAVGRIKLVLGTKPELELKEWVTSDAQGLDTRVEVSGVERPAELDANLFVIQHLGARFSTPR